MRSALRSLFAFLAVLGMVFGSVSLASAAVTLVPWQGEIPQVCPEGDSGKIDMEDLIDYETPTQEITAPDGYLISGFCVKAGSANQGFGPEMYSVDPAQKTLTLSHSSGKDLSHFSLYLVEDEGEFVNLGCSQGFFGSNNQNGYPYMEPYKDTALAYVGFTDVTFTFGQLINPGPLPSGADDDMRQAAVAWLNATYLGDDFAFSPAEVIVGYFEGVNFEPYNHGDMNTGDCGLEPSDS